MAFSVSAGGALCIAHIYIPPLGLAGVAFAFAVVFAAAVRRRPLTQLIERPYPNLLYYICPLIVSAPPPSQEEQELMPPPRLPSTRPRGRPERNRNTSPRVLSASSPSTAAATLLGAGTAKIDGLVKDGRRGSCVCAWPRPSRCPPWLPGEGRYLLIELVVYSKEGSPMCFAPLEVARAFLFGGGRWPPGSVVERSSNQR